MSKLKKFLIIFASWLMVAITIFIIVKFSLENNVESSASSNQIVDSFIKDDSDMSFEELDNIQRSVRKLAHFGIYMLLGFCLTNAFMVTFSFKIWFNQFLACFFAFVFSIFDEFVIQGNTKGRAPMISDVFIDFSGQIIGILLFTVLIIFINIYNKKGNLKN